MKLMVPQNASWRHQHAAHTIATLVTKLAARILVSVSLAHHRRKATAYHMNNLPSAWRIRKLFPNNIVSANTERVSLLWTKFGFYEVTQLKSWLLFGLQQATGVHLLATDRKGLLWPLLDALNTTLTHLPVDTLTNDGVERRREDQLIDVCQPHTGESD